MSTVFSPLKIHAPDFVCPFGSTAQNNLPRFAELNRTFEQATGWTLGYFEKPTSLARRTQAELPDLPIHGELGIVDMAADWPAGRPTASRQKCDELVVGLNSILNELDASREEIWRLNAELATVVPVVLTKDEQSQFAQQITKLLREMASGFGFSRAMLYLLDSCNDCLNLHFESGIGKDTPSKSRVLENAHYEMLAMSESLVQISDSREHSSQLLPMNCHRAVCVNVPSEKGSLGVIWMTDDWRSQWEFDERSLKAHAANIGTTLEKWSLIRELAQRNSVGGRSRRRENRKTNSVSAIEQPEKLDLDRLRLAKLNYPGNTKFSSWRYEASRGLTTAVVSVEDISLDAATASCLESAVHAAVQCTTALSKDISEQAELLTDVVQQAMSASIDISLGVMRIDLLTGEYQIAGHGNVIAMSGRGGRVSELLLDDEIHVGEKQYSMAIGCLNRGDYFWLGAMDVVNQSELIEDVKAILDSGTRARIEFDDLAGDVRQAIGSPSYAEGIQTILFGRP